MITNHQPILKPSITSRRNEDNMNFNDYKSNYYDIAASNYREKLPLIFEMGIAKENLGP